DILIGAEPFRIDAAEDDPRRRVVAVAGDRAAVLAEVQVAVEPAVGGNVRRHVPAAATEVADEHPPPRRPAEDRRQAAGQGALRDPVSRAAPPSKWTQGALLW